MIRAFLLAVFCFVFPLMPSAPATAARPPARPELWMSPPGFDNGRCFRELFEKPDAWRETRLVAGLSPAEVFRR